MSLYVFDIEANGFLFEATKIHCIVIKNIDTGEVYSLTGDSLYEDFAEFLRIPNSAFIGHNITGYDIPLINKLKGSAYLLDNLHDTNVFIDTFLASSMLYPDIKGGHSLEAWAERLSLETKKVQHEDWTVLTPEMINRCVADVDINEALFNYLGKNEDLAVLNEPCRLEASVADIHARQVIHGVRFNVLKAAELLKEFDYKINKIEEEILVSAPMIVEQPYNVPVNKPFKKDLSYSKATLDYFAGDEDILKTVKGKFSRINIRPINLDSPKETKDWLLREGWKPHKFTDKGNPKLTEELKGLEDSLLGSKFQELMMLKHRRKFLLNKSGEGGALTKVRSDGRVPAEAMTCATPTSRYRHGGAVCNIPRPRTPYGKEIRSLFCVPDSHTMLGADLKGIEARAKCQYALPYTGGRELMERVLSGDFHDLNASAWEVDRDTAKGGLYALMYGCGDAKLAATLGKPRSQGKKLREIFWKNNPALAELIEDLGRAYKARGGKLVGPDGRFIYIREERKLLNSLLQHSSAIIFKKWMELCDDAFQDDPMIHQVIAYHDELQFEVYSTDPEVLEHYSKVVKECALQAGRYFNWEVPTEADVKLGRNWAETH